MTKYLLLLALFFFACPVSFAHDGDHPELIPTEVFFPDGSFIMTTINATVVQNNYKNNPCPGVDPVALREERLKVLNKWVTRTNRDAEYILQVYDEVAAPDTVNGNISEYLHIFSAVPIGTLAAMRVAAEYAILAVNPNGVHLYSSLDPASIYWHPDNITVSYNIITNYTFYGGAFTLDGFVSQQTMVFVPCGTKVWVDASLQDPLAVRFLSSNSQRVTPEQICDLVIPSCTGKNTVYNSYKECLDYMRSVANNTQPCPAGYIGNTTICYQFHANSAVFLPEVHCPHTLPNSTVCRNFCLTRGCGNCSKDAVCVSENAPGDILTKYKCKCKEGYVGDGETCTKVPCLASWQCPGDYNFVTCNNGTCGCRTSGGFLWNSTQQALNERKICSCGPNETVQWYNNAPECIPKGRCREAWQCPQKNKNSITCAPYGTNPLIPYGTCLCNYGYDNPGFARDCQCSTPKREVWSETTKRSVCLSPSECTANHQCSSGRCHFNSTQDWLGTCVETSSASR